MSAPAEINLSSKIKSITCDSFDLEKVSKKVIQAIELDQVNFDLKVNFKPDSISQELHINSIIEIYSDSSKSNYLGKMTTTGVFTILNFDEIVKPLNGKFPATVVAMFIGILLSTTRGFLILKTEGTYLEGCILPIINPTSFFAESK